MYAMRLPSLDACGNLGEGFVGGANRAGAALGWDAIEVLVCPDDVANLSVNSVVQQPENLHLCLGLGHGGRTRRLESLGDGYYHDDSSGVFSATGAFQVMKGMQPDHSQCHHAAQRRCSEQCLPCGWAGCVSPAASHLQPVGQLAFLQRFYSWMGPQRLLHVLLRIEHQDELSVITLEAKTAHGDPVLTLTGSFQFAALNQRR